MRAVAAAAKWSDPGEDSLRMGAARREAAKLDPFAVGAYVNTLSNFVGSGLYGQLVPMIARRRPAQHPGS